MLRKEQSSPAVIQHTDAHGSLLKQVVTASGQGCAAAVAHSSNSSTGGHTPSRNAAIWRTRSVRSKAESYCILHLKGCSNRGITVQVSNIC